MLNILSDELARQIAQFQTATNIFDDLNQVWGNVQSRESKHIQLDSDAMRELAEKNVLKRITEFYTIRGKLGELVLNQAMKEKIIVNEDINRLGTREIINRTEELLKYLELKSILQDVVNIIEGTNDEKN